MFELPKGAIHALYIIGILLATIVALIAVEWGEVERLTETLSFALTLASLLLALLAIVYGFLSSSLFGRQVSDMTSISRDMSDANKELRESTENLRHEVREIPHRVEQVEEGLAKTHNLIMDKLANTRRSPAGSSPRNDPEFEQRFLAGYLTRSSYLGKRALYAAYVSHKRNLFFSPAEMSVHLDRVDFGDYLFGWLMAVNAFVSLDFEVDNKAHSLRTTEIPETLKHEIENSAESLRSEDDAGEVTLDAIDAYFDYKAEETHE